MLVIGGKSYSLYKICKYFVVFCAILYASVEILLYVKYDVLPSTFETVYMIATLLLSLYLIFPKKARETLQDK
ncbi:MAG: hypothetical protein ACK5LV_08525 [Lachnospirales bacterium]